MLFLISVHRFEVAQKVTTKTDFSSLHRGIHYHFEYLVCRIWLLILVDPQKPIEMDMNRRCTISIFGVLSIGLAISNRGSYTTEGNNHSHGRASEQHKHGSHAEVYYPIDFQGKQYSSHHCIGGHDYMKGAGDRSCVFHNVCHKKGEQDVIHYYVNPDMPRQPITSENFEFTYDFGKSYVTIGPYPQDNWVSRKWSPTVEEGHVPEGFKYDNASRHIFFESYTEQNPGELVNLLQAVYSLPLIHGYESHLDIKLLDAWGVKPRPKHRSQILMKGLTIHEPQYLHDAGDVCFETFFVGTGFTSILFGDHMIAFTADRMREYVLKNLGYPLPPPPVKHKILLLVKSSEKFHGTDEGGFSNYENHIHNVPELMAHLNATFGHFADCISLVPDHLPWDEQIAIIHSATVIITAPGGGSFGSFFARRGASVIFLDQLYNAMTSVRFAGGGSKLGMDDQWWTHMNSIKTFHYPICDDREHEKPGNYIIVLKRMQHMVVLAMLAAEETFKIGKVSEIVKQSLGKMPVICDCKNTW